MEYIILDNEWNTTFKKINGKCFNELIEIGAVKLDEELREVSRFSVLIRSTFTKKLSGRFQRLTNITTEEMLEKGMTFQEAVMLYSEWAGNGAVTLTWSNSDLYVLLENFRMRFGLETVPIIGLYADLQKYVQNEMILSGSTITSQISVSNAAIALGISIDGLELHRALDDSLLCAEILRKVYNKERLSSMVKDTASPDYYRRLTFKPYIIKNINDPLIPRQKFEFKCERCGTDAVRITSFGFKGQSFRAEFKCPYCGYKFIGRVTVKKNYDSVTVKRNAVPVSVVTTVKAEKKNKESAERSAER